MGRRMRTYFSEQPVRFITTTFRDWNYILTSESYFKIVCDSLNFVSRKYETDIVCYVLMPNHIHLVCVFTKPSRVSDYMRDFKKFTSGEIIRQLKFDSNTSMIEKLKNGINNYKVWKDRFDDYAILDVRSLHTKINYIHNNPVRKGLVDWSSDYKYSSAPFYQNNTQGPVNIVHFIEAMGSQSRYWYGQNR